jgi:hypothetical protein
MPNNTTHISVPLKGMNTDLHPANLTEQGYDFALNAVVEEFSGNGFPLLQNESSTLHCANFPAGYQLIGFVNIIEQDRKIIFLVNTENGRSEIGEIKGRVDCADKITDKDTLSYCDTCSGTYSPETVPLENQNLPSCCEYRTIANQTCFGFNINSPIRATYRLTECGIEVFFTDYNKPYRHIEFEYTNDSESQNLVVRKEFLDITGFDEDDCNAPIYSDQIDCNKLLLDPVLDVPCVELIDVIQGGVLRAGVYQFLIAYAEKDGTKRGAYFPATNQIPIFTRQITFDTNYEADRSIAIKINNIDEEDSAFDYINIAVAKTIDNVTSFELVGTYPITQKTIIYSGAEKSLKDLDPNEIFEQKVFYGKAKYVGNSNDYLFWAGLEETKKLNIQRIANNVKLNWQTVAIPESVYNHPRFVNKYRGYMRDEVYPFGLVLLFDNGEESVVGHIPGPSKAYFQSQYGLNVDTVIANNDVITDTTCANIARNKRWQVYNTGQIIGTNPSLPISGSCDDGRCYQFGDFAYWESTENYPNDPEIWGDLCGEPIRHHKFPDSLVTHIHDGLNDDKEYTNGNIVFPIGVRVDHTTVQNAINQARIDGIITQDDVARIKGYRIVRGNRFGNKSIIAKGLLFDVWNYIKDDITYFYPNYPYNDLRSDPFLTEDKSTYDDHDDREGDDLAFRKTGRYTFHSPDTHFVQPTIGDELKLEVLEYGQSEGYFNEAEEQAKQKLLSTTSYLLAFAGGIVAMLTTMEPEQCIDYTIKANVDITQEQTSFNSSGSGNAPYGNVVGSAPGATTTTPAFAAWNADIDGTVDAGDITEDHSTGTNSTFYDHTTGLNIGTTLGLGDNWTEKSVHTCKGRAHQYYNNPSLNALYGAFLFAQNLFTRISITIQETDVIVNLIKSMTPRVNYAIQYNSIGKYNNYENVTNAGFKRRPIETYSYLKPEMALIDESVSSFATGLTNIHFNNWHRETSVYLKVAASGTTFAQPTVVDDSRFVIGCRGSSSCDFKNFDKLRYYKNISSFYSSVKQFLPDQYGKISNIDYIDTGNCIFLNNTSYNGCDLGIYGGDTFISRFALKRKHSFFLQTRFMQQAETDVNYSVLGNVAYPRYYFDNVTGAAAELASGEGILDVISDPATFLGRPKSYLDSKTDKFFYQNGRMYLYSYGIPYFLVESDINLDYRYGQNVKEKDFYPHEQDLDFWLQEKNVSPSEDNYYFYNNTYSKQNKEHAYSQYGVKFEPGRMCKVSHPNRIIYSSGAQWLNYRANNFYDFPLANGKVTGVDGIENDKVLVRSENTTQIFNAYVTIPTSVDDIQVSTGGMFKSKPQEYAHTTLGYAGSQHNAILHTEFGHIWVDAKRGNVFNVSTGGLDEISKDGKKNWFKENLKFNILKEFPTLLDDVDNQYKGIGLVLGFDKRFNRFLLTKLDYKVLDDTITYDSITKEFKKGSVVVSLKDKKYFCDKSWTISYNFYTKAWTSYHSYHPNAYIDSIDYFVSAVNRPEASGSSSAWIHNGTNKSYQVFYGKLWPFIVQTITKGDINKNLYDAVEYDLDVIRYHNEYDPFYVNNVTFNKAIVFNQSQNSGLLELIRKDVNNLHQIFPISNANSTTIKVTNADGIWRFNQFYDLVQSRSNNIPVWLNDCANVIRSINPQSVDYQVADLDKKRIRGQYAQVRLINDMYSNYKFIFKYLVNGTVKTYR